MSLPVLARRVWKRLAPGPRPRHQLLLVLDEAGWILDEVAQQVMQRLPPGSCRAIAGDWLRARDCTVHLIDRAWAWSDGMIERAHPSNRLIAVWWHGRLDSPDPIIQAALVRLGRYHHRFARVQVTCSSGRETAEAVGVPREKIVMLPVGVDTRAFRPVESTEARHDVRQSLGIPDGAVVVGCFQKDGVGWDDGSEPKLIKGPDVFADAVIRLRERHPVHVLIPGPARGYLKNRFREANVPFSAPGMVPRSALPALHHAVDVYISPSRDEGGPAGALEAMASGVPVLATRAGIPADLIEPGVSGVLVAIDDPVALADAASELIMQPEQRRALAAEALVRVQAYDWAVVAARYASELYTPLSGAPSGR